MPTFRSAPHQGEPGEGPILLCPVPSAARPTRRSTGPGRNISSAGRGPAPGDPPRGAVGGAAQSRRRSARHCDRDRESEPAHLGRKPRGPGLPAPPSTA
ncbi:hypothetical protein SAMN05216207_1019108 [Pseudonocardia ammonioxydans]|uniref:Uncharacterized protein n=1 Tax=Pseudonocardia ammonioxydans TaxID=260086 RepID=A0A1I5B720_PSUAM|nr:hypothetical protein SAMN05216207_1019108 [Pseudonocardia ammonioxydans]